MQRLFDPVLKARESSLAGRMGTKSSKISNVADEMAATGGKNSGSVIDKLTEAQLDEFREAFNSFDKVPSQHAAAPQRAQETFCMGTTASGGAQKMAAPPAHRHTTHAHPMIVRNPALACRTAAAASTPRNSRI